MTENMTINKEMQKKLARAAEVAELAMQEFAAKYAPQAEKNFVRVLDAMRHHKISENHLGGATGYGYGDVGRDTLEQVYAEIFGAEGCLMRQQIVSGTHAISLALLGNLLPGDELLYVDEPYDTMQKVIGLQGDAAGSMLEMGIKYRQVKVDFAAPDAAAIAAAVSADTKIVAFQRSRGYAWRPALTIATMAEIFAKIKAAHPNVVIFVDNCYGEFVEAQEPTMVGADLIAGSLIKNLGGGIAPCGGYVAGRADLVERAACRLTAPGIGSEVGPALLASRVFYQGLYFAPLVVQEALCGAEYTAAFCRELGYGILPEVGEHRADIVQSVEFGAPERLIEFCRGIQKYSPVDSYVCPEPWDMPGYTDQVIMASGSFISGSSIELSADAPIRAPYIAYFQGGVNRYHAKIAVQRTFADMLEKGLL